MRYCLKTSNLEQFIQFLVEGVMGSIPVKFILNLDKWFRSRCYLKEKFIERTIDGRHMPDKN